MTHRIVYFDCTETTEEIAALAPEIFQGIECLQGDPVDEADLLRRLDGVTVAVNGHTPMSNRVLEALAPTLKRIVFQGTGVSTFLDVDHAESLGIEVLAVRDYGTRTVAEHAFSLLLAANRKIAEMDRALRRGDWRVLGGLELRGKTLGIVGLGAIGRETARIADAFGMRVVGWNRSPLKEDAPVEIVPLEAVFETADAVVLHIAHTAETEGMIGAEHLGRMKPGAILVNVARGEIVDRDALLAALRDGPLGHAALDVFHTEPLPPNDALLDFENVTLTAHAAWNSPEAAERLLSMGFDLARREIRSPC
jgi:D-3-phosphoglycerate dehydrogenase